MLQLRRVVGGSMLPTLKPHQIIVVGSPARLYKGQVVVVRRSGREMIKRIHAVDPARGVYVLGDNSAQSTDSRIFGWCDPSEITGRVIWPRIKPI